MSSDKKGVNGSMEFEGRKMELNFSEDMNKFNRYMRV